MVEESLSREDPDTPPAPSAVVTPTTLSEHLHTVLWSEQHQQQKAQNNPYNNTPPPVEWLTRTDAYVSWNGPSAQGHLPTLNWSTDFRKAYTLLLWLRPRIIVNEKKEIDKNQKETEDKDTTSNSTPQECILYRFSTSPDDTEATGVSVTCADWIYSPQDQTMSTTLTARHLTPHQRDTTTTSNQDTSSCCMTDIPLSLDCSNETSAWHLVGFTHVFPYLKKPTLTVTVNGQAIAHGALDFPVLSPDQHEMQHNVLLSHVVTPAVVVQETKEGEDDDDKKEKEEKLKDDSKEINQKDKQKTLESNSLNNKGTDNNNDNNNTLLTSPSLTDASLDDISLSQAYSFSTPTKTTQSWELDLAALSLYPVPIGSSIQAVTAQAGPQLALSSRDGRIVPTLPPVCNWSKGSSLEGPKVGIPLTVHSVALDLQRLSDQAVFSVSAMHARQLGVLSTNTATGDSRMVWTPHPQAGATHDTPRVGLVQPGPPVRHELEDAPSFYTIGACRKHDALHDYVAAYNQSHTNHETLTLQGCSPNWSICLQEQQLLAAFCLPLYMAIPPHDLLPPSIQTKSWQTLHELYQNDGALAACYLERLAIFIQHGGGRVHEQVLQAGALHIVASCLRIGLIRAHKYKVFARTTSDGSNNNSIPPLPSDEPGSCSQQSNSLQTPPYIPPCIVQASAQLVAVCCGPAAERMADLSPHEQIRKTSDLALTALFGFALDADLWGHEPTLLRTVAERYGGVCWTAGYILRSQMSVQHFLDASRLRLARKEDPQGAAEAQAKLLQAMLLSSLSNRRTIAQGEHDVAACVGALSDCPLGQITAHVILCALTGLLVWCEILPSEALPGYSLEVSKEEERKMQVASRLGRNLLIAQFHDVVAPMILSRTAFSGEQRATSYKHQSSGDAPGVLSWECHWRWTLLIFSWVSSVAGPDGTIAASSCGSLLLASGLAGSLQGALEDADEEVLNTMFLPPPGMALIIGSAFRNEWSYTDLLSDRLQIMIPLLPGMIVSLLSGEETSTRSVVVLSEILTAVGGAFHRVYGGIIHSTESIHSPMKKPSHGASLAIKAAKTFIPHLLVITMVLEQSLAKFQPKQGEEDVLDVLRPHAVYGCKRRADSDSWVDVSTSTSSESVVNELVVNLPKDLTNFDSETFISVLRSCQRSVLNTAAGLMSNAMALGGAGTTFALWQNVLLTLSESQVSRSTDIPVVKVEVSAESSSKLESTESDAIDTESVCIAKGVLCRLVAFVLRKALKRESQWDMWSYEMSSAVSKTCTLIEEKGLLAAASGSPGKTMYGADQAILLCVLLEILEYGRESTGWCQLALPSMPANRNIDAVGDVSEASKLMLPVLHPCFRIVLSTVSGLSTTTVVRIPPSENPAAATSNTSDEEAILAKVLAELERTLTASIVGLSFASARDSALNAMATLRKSASEREQNGDENGAQLCYGLICKIAEELRVRYESERRLRETALFDAYEDQGGNTVQQAVEGSQAIERLLFGGDGLGLGSVLANPESPIHELTKEQGTEEDGAKGDAAVSEDFVLFTEGSTPDEKATKLGFNEYEGLGVALEDLKAIESDSMTAQTAGVLSKLSPFLDRWDLVLERDATESELVDLFGEVSFGRTDGSTQATSPTSGGQSHISGSETAADAMSSFFEFAATEKSRLTEITARFLPSYRYSRLSFAERYCWSEYISLYSGEDSQMIWERTLSDGNRDIRSRLATFPAFPQFRPYIPSYLDHGPTAPSETNEDKPHHDDHRLSTTPAEIDAFTKTLLEAGDLEIVDITKKEAKEEDDPELTIEPNAETIDDAEADPFTELGPASTKAGSVDGADSAMYDSSRSSAEASNGKLETEAHGEEAQTAEKEGEPHEEDDSTGAMLGDFVGKGHHSITTSSFSTAPDNASSSISLMHSAAAGLVELHLDNCLHVKCEGNRQCSMLLTSTHLILEYEGTPEGFFEGEILAAEEEAERLRMIEEGGGLKDGGVDELYQKKASRRQREIASLRPKSIRYNMSEISHIYLRRYRLRDSSLEIFFIPSGGTSFGSFGVCSPTSSLFLDFGPGYEGNTRRDDAAFALMRRSPPQALKQWPDRSVQFLHEQLSRLTVGWAEGRVTNFDYLLHLNMLSGRTYNDICQYPVFPWVLSDYTSEDIPDLKDPQNFRDLSKPVGALNPDRLEDFVERFSTFADPSIPPFMYGSHYSTSAGVVLHFLVRLHPFAGLHRQLQGGHFDVADRLFSSVPRTWSMCTGSSAAEVKEVTPEWYCNPAFLRNSNRFKLGTSQDGEVLSDVTLPPWAEGSPEKFIEVMRAALESDVCSSMLPDWIDLIFGFKQQGPESIKANNVYFYLTYYGAVDVASIKDEGLRQATELQIAHFGQCPMQLFKHRPHVRRLPRRISRLPFYQLISAHCQKYRTTAGGSEGMPDEPLYLPFYSAPLSHWVHLDAPPPGPHAPLVAVRFAGTDRCLAVDGQGIFHTFRWVWRAEESPPGTPRQGPAPDKGCFVAQRELPRFRSVPRLMFSPQSHEQTGPVAVAISKTLFAGRSILLVFSDADGQGGFGMQLVDPAKGSIRGEVTVPQIHSARITCIATDPIGTAAGHGGVGGELAVVGSADGSASIWRFMSSHYLPMRPRLVLKGHKGRKVSGVAICAPIQIVASISSHACCLHSITNGTLIRTICPPENVLEVHGSDVTVTTKFADAPGIAISVQGFLVCVCESTINTAGSERKVAALTLFTIEGVLLGSQPLEPWRSLPHKIQCIPDGTVVSVCSGRGVTMHRISACHPLEIIDEWHVTELDDLGSLDSVPAAYDIEFGPSINRPVIAAAACSNGALRLHALPGISIWSERHAKSGISQTVGIALAKPARRLKSAVKEGLGIGSRIAGMGREIGREVTSDVKERGVGGFLNSMFGKGNGK